MGYRFGRSTQSIYKGHSKTPLALLLKMLLLVMLPIKTVADVEDEMTTISPIYNTATDEPTAEDLTLDVTTVEEVHEFITTTSDIPTSISVRRAKVIPLDPLPSSDPGVLSYELATKVIKPYNDSGGISVMPPIPAAILPRSSGGQRLSTGAIGAVCAAGAVLTILGIVGVGWWWRRHIDGETRAQALSEKSSATDSVGYIDDALRDADEMLSLDNDSFLNSLEAMTIQNYWTDSVRHTKL